MPKRSTIGKDEIDFAKSILDEIIEETEREDSPETERQEITRKAGKARAAKLTADERSAIARKAAQARWKKESV